MVFLQYEQNNVMSLLFGDCKNAESHIMRDVDIVMQACECKLNCGGKAATFCKVIAFTHLEKVNL